MFRVPEEEKSAAVFAVRRANYTHRRKGVFNAESIEDLNVGGNVRYRTVSDTKLFNCCLNVLVVGMSLVLRSADISY